MKLKSYLSRNGLTQSQFALAVKADASHINKLLAGTRSPSLKMVLAIERASKGAVTLKDWV